MKHYKCNAYSLARVEFDMFIEQGLNAVPTMKDSAARASEHGMLCSWWNIVCTAALEFS
jgi:hypothetical protein